MIPLKNYNQTQNLNLKIQLNQIKNLTSNESSHAVPSASKRHQETGISCLAQSGRLSSFILISVAQ